MSNNNLEHTREKEIDLREIFAAIWDGKWLIIAFLVIASILSLLISLNLKDRYRSSALLAPKYEEGGGLGSLVGQYSGLANMAGLDVPGSEKGGKVQVAIKTMESFHFFDRFLYEDFVVPLMAVNSWESIDNQLTYDTDVFDDESMSWKSKPTSQQTYSTFLAEFELSEHIETGFITLTLEHYSPVVAKDMLQSIVSRLNLFMREQDISEAEQSIGFLSGKMDENKLVSLDEMFARLIEEQTKTIMLANVSEDYLFRVIEPPIVVEEKYSPSRALICLLGTFLGGLCGLLVVFAQSLYFVRDS